MSNNESEALRSQVADALTGHQSHIEFESVVKDFPVEARGKKVAGAPHTAWQLLEHLRITQNDILEFSRNASHKSPKWPDEYWPKSDTPPDAHAWDSSVKAYQKDAKEMEKLVKDPKHDLLEPFAHGEGQTLLREALLVATHSSYHLGQLVFLKKMLLGKA